MCVSISHNEIVAGRIISSIGPGVLSMTPPIYIAKICTTVIHGQQIVVNCILIAIGHLFSVLVSSMLTKVRTYDFCFFFFFLINTYFVISEKAQGSTPSSTPQKANEVTAYQQHHELASELGSGVKKKKKKL